MSQPDIGALRAACRSGDPDQQLPALLELITIHDEASVPDIAALLTSPDEQVRAEAARAVGYLGSTQVASLGPQLVPLLNDADELVRDEATEALGLLVYPPASDALKGVLSNDPVWFVRASAAEALGNYQDASLLPLLEQVLHNPKEEATVRAYAARSLGRIADAAYLPVLNARIAAGQQEPLVSAALLAAAYRLGGQEHLDPLLTLLRKASEEESWSLLNEVQDLVEEKQPATLAIDSPRIRAALEDVAQRWPLTAQQAHAISSVL
ncbi:MAG TPA: HEAT repeat domain-containing protein [Ktedonobacteraceae bacterium]|jgi:HEAT repeat protein